MAHGKIHEDRKTHRRANDPTLHFLQRILLGILLFFFFSFGFTGYEGTIARLGNRLDNGGCYFGRFSLHLHSSCQQIDFR